MTGRVAQVSRGIATVTVSDEYGSYGETVSVSSAEGKKLGSGELYIHSALKVTGFSGTVSAVYVYVDSSVYAGQSLLSLTDTDYAGEYEALIAQREEYSKEMERLMAMYKQGYVYAECDGIIGGISDSAKYSQLAYQTESGSIVLLSNFTSGEKYSVTPLSSTSDAPESSPTTLPETTTAPAATTPPETTTPPAATASPEPTATPVPTATPEPTATPAPSEPRYTQYVGKVTAVSYGQISMLINPSPVSMSGGALSGVDESSFTTAAQYSPGAGTAVYVYENGGAQSASIGAIQSGDLLLLSFTDDELTQIDCVHSRASGTNSPDAGQQGGVPSMGSSASAGAAAEAASEYTLSETVLCSIIPDGKMNVVLSVDELDILSLKVGQEAVISLDAVSGQSFSGTVTGLDPVGVNEGGGTKYSVTLTLARTDLMLNGMNASARITVSTLSDALLIPVAAIHEQGAHSYVYTDYDSKSDTLLSPVEVTTGVSDGDSVQILSGLVSGDKYYYKYAETLVYTR